LPWTRSASRFVIAALEGIAQPIDNLADQKIALVRIFFHNRGAFWVTQTVEREFERIKDARKLESHRSWTSAIFYVYRENDLEAVKRRSAELKQFHSDEDDRMILAEAEDIRSDVLLSFDRDFVKRLGPQARIRLTTPLELWEDLGVPKGAQPKRGPAADNPLIGEQWWRW
jgi:predicted nucleic acid-binding protein